MAKWSAHFMKIQDTAQTLNEAGTVPKSLRNDLESRLVLAWGESVDLQDASTTNWRKRHAQNIYQEIQDANHHLFLVFILATGPTTCSRPGFQDCVQALLKADQKEPQKIQLNPEAKQIFDSIVVRREFGGNARCVNFMKSLFAEGKDYKIQYAFSSAPLDSILCFNEPIHTAIQNGHLWNLERERQESSTRCVTVMIPSDTEQDASINIQISYDDGFRLREMLRLQQITI